MSKGKHKKISGLRKAFLEGISVPEQSSFDPDVFQVEAIESVLAGCDTLVVAPTGAGKTYIAVECIKKLVPEGKRVVYTTPLKALSNTKYSEFKKGFAPEIEVGLLTGDRKIDGDSPIVVATTEIYRNELYSAQENYSLVVLDEFHYLADAQRGPVWEESVILSPRSSTLLMLSASISNAEEIADWVQVTRNKEVRIISETTRPVELRLGFLHPEHGVIPLEKEDGRVEEVVQSFYRGGGMKNYDRRRKGGKNRSSSRRGRDFRNKRK